MAFTYANVAVTTAVVTLVPQGAEAVVVMNNGPNAIAIGDGSVATGTGLLVPAGATIRLNPRGAAISAAALTANQVSPADTRVWTEV